MHQKQEKLVTHGSSSGGVLGSTTSDICHLGVLDDIVVATISVGKAQDKPSRRLFLRAEGSLKTHIGMCFSSARIASFEFNPYFSR